jgi:NADH-quinone oxidoreductase subunit N
VGVAPVPNRGRIHVLLMPESVLMARAVVALATGSYLPRYRQSLLTRFAIMIVCASATAAVIGSRPPTIFDGNHAQGAATVRLLVRRATAVALLIVVTEFLLATVPLHALIGLSRTSADA